MISEWPPESGICGQLALHGPARVNMNIVILGRSEQLESIDFSKMMYFYGA